MISISPIEASSAADPNVIPPHLVGVDPLDIDEDKIAVDVPNDANVDRPVVPDESGKVVVYAQFLTYFRLRGDEEEIVAPRFFVVTVGSADGMYEGTDGLQIYDLRLFWGVRRAIDQALYCLFFY